MTVTRKQMIRRAKKAIWRELRGQSREGYPSTADPGFIVHPTVVLVDTGGKKVAALAGGFDLQRLAEAVVEELIVTEPDW